MTDPTGPGDLEPHARATEISAEGAGPSSEGLESSGAVAAKPLNRRRFLGWAATGGAVAAAAAFGLTELGDHDPRTAPAGPGSHVTSPRSAGGSPPGSTGVGGTHKKVPGAALFPTSAAIIAENSKTGTAWWVTTPQREGDIEGFADMVSAVHGDTVRLFVSTKAASFHVEAYRMGYYQGIGARLVWRSAEVAGLRQPPPALIRPTNTIQCAWSPSLTVAIGASWPPGAYLLKLVGATNEQQFVPLCVRDDSSKAAVVIQHSVTTWQAYNRWGGYSLYYGNTNGSLSYTHDPAGATYADRARIVSYDRPYDHDWASGAADFVGNEFPAVFQAERLGLDVTYWTDLDLHARPQLLTSHRALISLGHDEYWSQPMRDAAGQAVTAGVNLAFLGANACFRQIRLQPSPLGADRTQVCYKSAAEDPMAHVNPALTTVNWPDAPVLRPEAQLIGSTYQDVQAMADMVVTDASSWLYATTGLTDGQHLPNAVQGEFDRYIPAGAGPANADVLAHSIVANRGGNYSDVTWYTVPGGGGVFSSGNANWVGLLSDNSLIPPNVVPHAVPGVTAPLLAMTENLYQVIGSGPASYTHPSSGTWKTVYTPGSRSSAAPSTVNSA